MKTKKILFVYQYAYSLTGGIQTYNKTFISALEKIAEQESISVNLLSIYDKWEDIDSSFPFKVLGKSKLRAFIEIFKSSYKYDNIILSHVNLSLLGILIKILSPKTKITFCTHGIDVWKKLPKHTEWIMNRSSVLTVSSFSADKLKEFNPKLRDVSVIPNSIKLDLNKENFNNPYSKESFNILSVTRLDISEKDKGIDTVIKSLPFLIKDILNIKYTVVGKGEDLNRLRKLALDLNVENYIDFLGFVDKLEPYYQHCDLFILPSKKEGFGIVYLEAMQYKKVVIGVNYGGPTDVIDNGKTGYLCDYDDSKDIAVKIKNIYDNPKLNQAMGEEGYNKLLEKFTFESFVENLKKYLLK